MTVSISTHVLDTAEGRPAEGVRVEVWRTDELLAADETDTEGRITRLVDNLEPGTYSLAFIPPSPFFTRVELQVELVEGHHHIPLLVSPYGCATYRGS
ncbi:MAG: hydroxyisourate hydrolase [Actinobacteria bacterium]|nr:hydroxyisourate hydrolase [Actinomycetota bacterium]